MRVPVVLFALSIFALRILSLIPRVIDVDEAWFAASAAALESPFEFFTRAIDNKPPGTVWFFWLVDKVLNAGADPRFARACALVGVGAAAWFTSLCVERRKRWLAGAVFLMASALPSPKLLATTTEGLMLPLLCFVLWIGMKGLSSPLRAYHTALAGLALGVCLLLKQTAVFFVPAYLYLMVALHGRKHLSVASALIGAAFFVLPGAFAVSQLGAQEFWYWTVSYPAKTLSSARELLFSQPNDLLLNTALFALALWPLSLALRPARWKAVLPAQRVLLALWLGGGAATVLVGYGLFFHYYIFLLPPLVVLFVSGTAVPRLELRWLGASYASVCLLASVPALGTLWGSDLSYYERLGQYVDGITHPNDKVFVWSGNAMALATSGRKFATRFVTARHVAPPYSSPESEALFKKDFLAAPPALFIDLHERGDGRFNTPVEAHPWLAAELGANYRAFRDPALSWVTFYKRADRGAGGRFLANAREGLEFDSLYKQVHSILNEPFNEVSWKTYEFTKTCLKRYERAVALEELLRVWDGLRVLSESTPGPDDVIEKSHRELRAAIVQQAMALAKSTEPGASPNEDAEAVSLARRTRVWLVRQFAWLELPLPLSLESPAWWASFAMVKLQPVAWPDLRT